MLVKVFQAVVCTVCSAVCDCAFVGDKNISAVKMHGATIKKLNILCLIYSAVFPTQVVPT